MNCGGISLQVVRHPGREPAAELVRAGPLRGLARLLRRGDVEPQHAHGRGLPLPQRRRPQESSTGQQLRRSGESDAIDSGILHEKREKRLKSL